MKRTRPATRFRRFVKRLAMTATILLAATWLGTLWWRLSFVSPGNNYEIAASTGALRVDWIPFAERGIVKLTFSAGFHFSRQYFIRHKWLPSISIRGCPGNVVIPLWLPTAVALGAVAVLWWPDLRARWYGWRLGPNHCLECGYDLTGNVSGRCPECGRVFKRIDATPANGRGM